MSASIDNLENQLQSFDITERKSALKELAGLAENSQVKLESQTADTNVHLHTFYSYNACGYSPSTIAWLCKKRGLAVSGIVDFDVLDGLEEFYDAAAVLDLRGCVGIETRVFVPEFADKVINSPGEPGVSYHMGVGMPTSKVPAAFAAFKTSLSATARQRNIDLITKVNAYLSPAELNYEKDVLGLTPSGNATERHICLAYARKAKAVIGDGEKLLQFWNEKLSGNLNASDLPEGPALINLIRGKTMKRGGVGYVQPGSGSFPSMHEMNSFVLGMGGIPTLAWLDGTSDGEKAISELLRVAMSSGVAAINIIPDRNYTPGLGDNDQKCKNLYAVMDMAQQLKLPIIAGTEMNSPGQKFVDDFACRELAPLAPVFTQGAYIVYAHSVLMRCCGIGYIGSWSHKHFADIVEKNSFFEMVGKSLSPHRESALKGLTQNVQPADILNKIK